MPNSPAGRRPRAGLRLLAAAATGIAAAAVSALPAAPAAAAGPAPWFATLLDGGAATAAEPHCGGALITPTRVVTAAHCVAENTPAGLQVRIGDRSLRAGAGVTVPVAGITVHPDYARIPVPGSRNSGDDTARADVAVIELARPVRDVTPLAVAGTSPTAGTETTVFGHGRQRERRGSGDVPGHKNRLTPSTQLVLGRTDCLSRAHGQVVDATMLCTRLAPVAGNPPICTGDSGGPLVRHTAAGDRLVGVISAQTSGSGTICQQRSSAALATDVAAFGDWLTGPLQAAPVPIGQVRVRGLAGGRSRCEAPRWRPDAAPTRLDYIWFGGAGDTWLELDGQTAKTYAGPIPAPFLRCGIYARNAGGTALVLSR